MLAMMRLSSDGLHHFLRASGGEEGVQNCEISTLCTCKVVLPVASSHTVAAEASFVPSRGWGGGGGGGGGWVDGWVGYIPSGGGGCSSRKVFILFWDGCWSCEWVGGREWGGMMAGLVTYLVGWERAPPGKF